MIHSVRYLHHRLDCVFLNSVAKWWVNRITSNLFGIAIIFYRIRCNLVESQDTLRSGPTVVMCRLLLLTLLLLQVYWLRQQILIIIWILTRAYLFLTFLGVWTGLGDWWLHTLLWSDRLLGWYYVNIESSLGPRWERLKLQIYTATYWTGFIWRQFIATVPAEILVFYFFHWRRGKAIIEGLMIRLLRTSFHLNNYFIHWN